MKALIDGDILLYRVGFTTETETEAIAQYRMTELIERILNTVQATSYAVYLSCGRAESFRAKLNPQYKANRTQPKPLHYQFLKDLLINQWNAEVAVEEEADDLIGIAQAQNPETIACTIDKDILFGVEGNKYNFVKEEMYYTSEEEALRFFYKQLLMGDKADNILGIPGVGPKTADKYLDAVRLGTHQDYLFIVKHYYREWLHKEWADRFLVWTMNEEKAMNDLILLSGRQLKIRSKVGEIWEFPDEYEPFHLMGVVNAGVDEWQTEELHNE